MKEVVYNGGTDNVLYDFPIGIKDIIMSDDITLKEFVETIFNQLKEIHEKDIVLINQKLDGFIELYSANRIADKESKDLVARNIDAKHLQMNEIREQLNQQARTFMLQEVQDSKNDDFGRRIGLLEKSQSTKEGSTAFSTKVWGAIVAIVVIVIAALVVAYLK